MSLFSLKSKKERFGVIIEIGSGSVLTAIVHSVPNTKHPMILWAHREHTSLKEVDSISQSAKAVLAALVNASIKLDSEGRKRLKKYKPDATLTELQCTISAPWSYTVTKSVNIKQDEPFEITNDLIDDLIFSAQKQVEEELREHESTADLGLSIITKSTMDMLSNGYRVKHPEGETSSKLQLTQATVVAQQYLIDGVEETRDKLFTQTKTRKTSFMLMFFCMVRQLHQHMDEVCLIDVTDEATEIGIVRDGSLTYATHSPFGIVSLAREISHVTGVPLSEAVGHLRTTDVSQLQSTFPESKQDELAQVFQSYTEEVATLFNQTGDTLSIPKTILLNVESTYDSLFSKILQRAAQKATKIEHVVTSFSTEILDTEQKETMEKLIGDYIHDTSLLLTAEFFHTESHCLDFKYY